MDETRTRTVADARKLYETLKTDYEHEGCSETWGDFPSKRSLPSNNNNHNHNNSSSSSSSKPSMESLQNTRGKGGMACTCGMIYDLAVSASKVLLEDKQKMPSTAEAARTKEKKEEQPQQQQQESKQMTETESWIMARTANSRTPCVQKFAGGWPCKKVDLIAHLPLDSFRTSDTFETPKTANDVWGWTSSNREFVIWGVREGFYFLEVFANSDPLLVGYLPATNSRIAYQADAKVVGDFVYIGSEAYDHGIQMFDMKGLLQIDPSRDCFSNAYCRELTEDVLFKGGSGFPIGASHNIVANQDTKYLYVVGTRYDGNCDGGLHVVDVWNPFQPRTVACFKDDGYVHDAQCVNYEGPDPNYQNREICFCFNESRVTIVDVTNKNKMVIISIIKYDDWEYTHQGWLSSDQSHIVFGDEYDEYFGLQGKTRTLVVNIENLRTPTNIREYFSAKDAAVDHNQYVVKATAQGQGYDPKLYRDTDLIYQANYRAGLRILQVLDYEKASFKEVGYFDTYPMDNLGKFGGAWSVFPYFQSGVVAISSESEGLFLVKPDLKDTLIPIGDCIDDPTFEYNNQRRHDCGWVGNRTTKKRCDLVWNGATISRYCKATCGSFGIGECKDKVKNEKGNRRKRRKKKKKKKKNTPSAAKASIR